MSDNRSKSVQYAIRYLKKSARMLKVLKVLGTVVGAALIAFSRVVAAEEFQYASELSILMLIAGIVLAAVGSLVLIFIDDTAPDVLAENLNLEKQHADLQSRFDQYDNYQNHLLARLTVNGQVRELVEQAVVDGVPDKETLAKHAQAIVTFFVERRVVLFGIQDEYWNFSVYLYDEATRELRCIACRRENSDDENEEHRAWGEGEGHVGVCFARAKEIILSDATKPELLSVFEAQGENARLYDQERYVSVASMPISSDGAKPLGVLIATSSKVGRFKNDEERSTHEWETADTLRDVASSIAIIFQLIHATNNHGRTEDDGT